MNAQSARLLYQLPHAIGNPRLLESQVTVPAASIAQSLDRCAGHAIVTVASAGIQSGAQCRTDAGRPCSAQMCVMIAMTTNLERSMSLGCSTQPQRKHGKHMPPRHQAAVMTAERDSCCRKWPSLRTSSALREQPNRACEANSPAMASRWLSSGHADARASMGSSVLLGSVVRVALEAATATALRSLRWTAAACSLRLAPAPSGLASPGVRA